MSDTALQPEDALPLPAALPALPSATRFTATTATTDTASDTARPSSTQPLAPWFIRAIFLLLGVGILIPWNAFVSAKSYFQARLCQHGQVLVNFELWFGLVWNTSSVLSLGLIIASVAIQEYCQRSWTRRRRRGRGQRRHHHHHQRATEGDLLRSDNHGRDDGDENNNNNSNSNNNNDVNFNDDNFNDDNNNDDNNNDDNNNDGHDQVENTTTPTQKPSQGHSMWLVMVPLALYLAVFAVTAILVLLPAIRPQTFLTVTLIGLAICGTCGAIATAGIVSTAGLFQSHLGITPFFSGQALGGVCVALSNLLTASLEDPKGFWEQSCPSPPTNNHTATIKETAMAVATMAATATAKTNLNDYKHSYTSNVPYEITSAMDMKTTRRLLDLTSALHNQQVDDDDDDNDSSTCTPYSDLDWAVFCYFFVGCVVLAACLVGYTIINRYQQQEHRDDYEVVQDASLMPVGDDDWDGDDGAASSPRMGVEMRNGHGGGEERTSRSSYQDVPTTTTTTATMDYSNDTSLDVATVPTTEGLPPDEPDTTDAPVAVFEEYTQEESEIAVFSAIKGPACCTFLVFTVTLCLFPSWISQLRSTHECESRFRLFNDLYVPTSFVVFNIGDLVGRVWSEQIPVQHIPHLSFKLVVASLCRLVFFPLLLMCVTEHSHSTMVWIPTIQSDLYSLFVQFGFAVTNGLLVSSSFMYAPHLVAHTTGMQERASEMMTFAVFFGLLSGSLLSFPFSVVVARL